MLMRKSVEQKIFLTVIMSLGRMFDTNHRLSWLQSWLQWLDISSALIGIGMITGFKIALDAFFGMIFGWAVLPLYPYQQEGSKDENTSNHAEEQRLWHALTALLVDCLFDLGQALLKSDSLSRRSTAVPDSTAPAVTSTADQDAVRSPPPATERAEDHSSSKMTDRVLFVYFIVAGFLCVVVVNWTAGRTIPWWVPFVAIILAIPAGYLAIQTEGVTGREPISALGICFCFPEQRHNTDEEQQRSHKSSSAQLYLSHPRML